MHMIREEGDYIFLEKSNPDKLTLPISQKSHQVYQSFYQNFQINS